ncbi:MAG TPA: amino acid deaminase [Mycobacteriales bacterium]|nr:amino acid deaminase [Mycobacteriales bacterium]
MAGELTGRLDWSVKGAPGGDTSIEDLLARRPSLFDAGFLFPLLVLKDSALRSNAAAMRAFCERQGARLAPHGKTHMSPQLAQRQLEDGAWGITVATTSQARVYRAAGVPRIFMANELVDPAGIRWVAEQLSDPDFEFLCYVDSVAGVRLLAEQLGAVRRPLDVLVEVGPVGARTGCRTVAEAARVASAAAAEPSLRVRGVSGYEGGFGHGDTPDDEVLEACRAYLRFAREAGEAIAKFVPDDTEFLASAGGSVYFDLVAETFGSGWNLDRPVTTVLRSGCYLVHDSGSYRRQTPFGRSIDGELVPAMHVWGLVLSQPEPGLALVGMGRRDVSFDIDLPFVESVRHRDGTSGSADGVTVSALNDQHAYLRFDGESPVSVGDLVSFGISHPCTCFDKWQFIPVIDDDDRVIDYVRTYF